MHNLRRVVGVLSVAAMIAGLAAPVMAGGVGAVPGTVEIDDALRGSTVFTEVFVFNDTGTEVPFSFDFIGEAAEWMSVVDPDDRETAVNDALDADGSGASATIRIDVPGDTSLGEYTARLRASLAPPESDGDGISVGLGVQIPITINVTGTQVIAGTLLGVSLRDTEAGLPARVQISIENEGNTRVTPEFSVEVLSDGATATKMTTSGVPSFPGEQRTFEVRWDTVGATPGDYTARVGIDFGGQDLGVHELEFTLHPSGTLSRVAVLTSLVATGEANAGGLAGFTAVVINPGQADVSGTFVGELAKDGVQVSAYESQPFLILAGEELAFPINIEVPDEGEYVFSGRFRYGDEETESMSVAFSTVATGAEEAAADGGTDETSPVLFLIVALLLLGAVGGGGWWLFSRRSSPAGIPDDDPTRVDETEAATRASND